MESTLLTMQYEGNMTITLCEVDRVRFNLVGSNLAIRQSREFDL